MPIPTSGPVKFSDLQTEFGGANPISLSEYYAGGANVPSGTSGPGGPVPSSGVISVSDFYGTSEFVPTITLNYTYATDVTPRGFAVSISVNSSGNVVASGADGATPTYAWIDNASFVGDYEIYGTVTSGGTPSGTLNTWVNGATGVTWSRSSTAYDLIIIAVSIRDVATQTVRATANFELESGQ